MPELTTITNIRKIKKISKHSIGKLKNILLEAKEHSSPNENPKRTRQKQRIPRTISELERDMSREKLKAFMCMCICVSVYVLVCVHMYVHVYVLEYMS